MNPVQVRAPCQTHVTCLFSRGIILLWSTKSLLQTTERSFHHEIAEIWKFIVKQYISQVQRQILALTSCTYFKNVAECCSHLLVGFVMSPLKCRQLVFFCFSFLSFFPPCPPSLSRSLSTSLSIYLYSCTFTPSSLLPPPPPPINHSHLQLFIVGAAGKPPIVCDTNCPSEVACCGKKNDLFPFLSLSLSLSLSLHPGDQDRPAYCQPPIIPGHEFVGEVVKLGEGNRY